VRPDGYGRWRDADAEVDFFVEVDRATEPPRRLGAKLTGHRNLAAATKIAAPVLFWFPTPERETAVRAALATSSANTTLLIATASSTPRRRIDPAGPVWLMAARPRTRYCWLASGSSPSRGPCPGPAPRAALGWALQPSAGGSRPGYRVRHPARACTPR
jgi:hypothetical protein